MKEPQITAKIVAALNGVEDCFSKKRHSGKFGGGGEPDISGCFLGRSLFIETKMRDGALTLLQAAALERWRKSGAATFVAIYDPVDKLLKVVALDDHEEWEQFVGGKKIREIYDDSAVQKLPFAYFDFEQWLVNAVRGE